MPVKFSDYELQQFDAQTKPSPLSYWENNPMSLSRQTSPAESKHQITPPTCSESLHHEPVAEEVSNTNVQSLPEKAREKYPNQGIDEDSIERRRPGENWIEFFQRTWGPEGANLL